MSSIITIHMRISGLLTIVFLSLIPATVTSQVIVKTGIVRDEHNKPIAHCHVSVKNTNLGTVTNAEGRFKLKIAKDACHTTLAISHLGYQTHTVKLRCQDTSHLLVRLRANIHQLQEVTISALSPSQIVLKAILNLEKNFQTDSVTYTLFSRITETSDTLPVLIKEFVFDLFHGKNAVPDFYIEKIRVKGFSKLGKKRLDDSRLTDIYGSGKHIMLRYLPPFLIKSKMNRYSYKLIDEVVFNKDRYYVIAVNSLKSNDTDNGKIRIHQKNYGISYLEERYIDEHWPDMSHLNYTYKSHYRQEGDKWYFTHGIKSYDEVLKSQNTVIKHHQVTVATNRVHRVPAVEKQAMGRMVKMLKDYAGSYQDEFWEGYNFIPLENRFRDD